MVLCGTGTESLFLWRARTWPSIPHPPPLVLRRKALLERLGLELNLQRGTPSHGNSNLSIPPLVSFSLLFRRNDIRPIFRRKEEFRRKAVRPAFILRSAYAWHQLRVENVFQD